MWSCSRRGFPSTRHRCRAWWALTPPFHPYPCAGRSSFLWHCPWGRPLSRFGTALPCGARTFLPPLPGSDHLTRSDSKNRSQETGARIQKKIIILFRSCRSPDFLLLAPDYVIFSSMALFASASASLFIKRGMYCTSTVSIFAISSLALV
jgi:hypothetical protein